MSPKSDCVGGKGRSISCRRGEPSEEENPEGPTVSDTNLEGGTAVFCNPELGYKELQELYGFWIATWTIF